MELFESLVKALSEHPAPAITAMAVAALAYLFKELRQQEREHRETLTKILPLAEKMADASEGLERITTAVLSKLER